MESFSLVMVAVALGTDAFSLSAGLALGGFRRRNAFLFIAAVGVFHVIMPLAGLYAGLFIGRFLDKIAAVVGALVLVILGIVMFKEAFSEGRQNTIARIAGAVPGHAGVVSGAAAVVLMASSVSIDALSVGFGLGAINVNIPLTVMIMGAIAALMTASGFLIGRRLGAYLGSRAQMLGGVILVVIGLTILWGVR